MYTCLATQVTSKIHLTNRQSVVMDDSADLVREMLSSKHSKNM